jgi:hypothetical protein
MQQPSIGRIVHYRLTLEEAATINERRADYAKTAAGRQKPLFQPFIGNPCGAGDVVPMVIAKVWPGELVNGQALLDGTDGLWVTSAKQGDGLGEWSWPPRS